MRKTDFEYKYLGSCPVCSSDFEPRKASIIDRQQELSHILAQCGKCNSSVSCYVLKSKAGFVTTVGMLTDFKQEDIKRFKNAKPITADDVLEIHKSLEEKN